MTGVDILGWHMAGFMILLAIGILIFLFKSCFPNGIHFGEFKETKKYRYETRTEDTGKREYDTDYGPYADNVTVHRIYLHKTFRINKKTGEEKLVRVKSFCDHYSFWNH